MSTALLDHKPHLGEEDEYLQQIRQFPRLTPEEERALAKRCAEGDE